MADSRSLDPIWEQKYADGHVETYPWDSVVSFVFRNAPRQKARSDVQILEVGCGTGSNLWFAAREGFKVTGIDGSPTAIDVAIQRFRREGLAGDLRVGDFTSLPFSDDTFDLVIDRAALTCCGVEQARKAFSEIRRVMRPGGKFFFNPYSDRHSSYSGGRPGLDGLTLGINSGSLVGVGQICFYGRQLVLSALGDFRILSLIHSEWMELLQPGWSVHAEWRVTAEKTM